MKVSASILSADFSCLKEEIEKSSKAEMLHIDVMDGSFVPNITIGSCVIKSLRKTTSQIFDVHLMVQKPIYHIDDFVNAGADIITVHLESDIHICRTLNYIRSKGKKSGIAIVPSTDHNSLRYVLPYVDLILIMTVNPGFAGQCFMHCQLEKIVNIKKMIQESGFNIYLSVDGGIDEQTCKKVNKKGVDVVVSGSYIYSAKDYNYNERIQILQQT